MAWLSTKTYGADRGLSCAWRQWAARSHCALLHGYSLGFRFTFAAEQLDERGWVIDFGKDGFGPIRDWLHETFDHTLLVAADDPERAEFLRLRDRGLAEVRILPGAASTGAGPFRACPACGRLYWPGSHVRQLAERLDRLADVAASAFGTAQT